MPPPLTSFIPSLVQRKYLDAVGVPQPRLLATITAPHELATLELPDAWALKPVGAAYSQGLVLVDGGKVLNNQGLPYNLWEVVANIRGVQATGCHCHRHRLLLHLHHLTSSIPSLVQAMHGRVAVTEAGSDVRYNCECFLVEELVKDGHEKYGT